METINKDSESKLELSLDELSFILNCIMFYSASSVRPDNLEYAPIIDVLSNKLSRHLDRKGYFAEKEEKRMRRAIANDCEDAIFFECALLREGLGMRAGTDLQLKKSAEKILEIIRGA